MHLHSRSDYKVSTGDTIGVATGMYIDGTGNKVVLINKEISLSDGWGDAFTSHNSTLTFDGENARPGFVKNSGVNANFLHFTV